MKAGILIKRKSLTLCWLLISQIEFIKHLGKISGVETNMKEVLKFIEAKQQEFAQKPLFDFMRNQSIPSEQRMAFVPQISYFVMFFGDLNKYILREEPTNDPIQKPINQYTHEDYDHWNWVFLDVELLGFNDTASFVDVLNLSQK